MIETIEVGSLISWSDHVGNYVDLVCDVMSYDCLIFAFDQRQMILCDTRMYLEVLNKHETNSQKLSLNERTSKT